RHFDVGAAGMSILPERCEYAIFSEPEFQYTTTLKDEWSNPYHTHDMQYIRQTPDDGQRMAAMTGAREATYSSLNGFATTGVGNRQDGMDLITNGRADVFALTGISLNWMLDNASGDPGV